MMYNVVVVRNILRLEGLAFFLFSAWVYSFLGGSWLTFFGLLFVPDVSMIGYVKDKKLGAITYNLVHTYVLGLIIFFIGAIIAPHSFTSSLGLILIAHVGMDRFFGYGLKYPTGFKDTHMQKV